MRSFVLRAVALPWLSVSRSPTGVTRGRRRGQVRRLVSGNRHVRVLWDIENVPLPAAESAALGVVSRLLGWLSRQGLGGPGVDCTVTAFHCAAKRTLHPGADRALQRACVEQVGPPAPQPPPPLPLQFSQILSLSCRSHNSLPWACKLGGPLRFALLFLAC